MYTKNVVILAAGYLGQNDVTWGQADSIGVKPNQVNKSEELTCLSTNI
jgi:hypothetical protein